MMPLVYKDFYQTRKVLIYCLLIWAIFLGLGMINTSEGGVGLIYSAGIIITNTMLTRILYNEDRYQGIYFMKTLPLKSSLIVTSKFFVGFILSAGSSLLVGLAASIIWKMGLHGFTTQDAIAATLVSFAFTLIFCGFFLKLYFAYGYAKVAQYMVLVTIGVVIILSTTQTILKELTVRTGAITAPSQAYWLVMLPLIGLITYTICWRSTLKSFK